MTIRFPSELLARAKKVKAERESLNDLVIDAVDREVRRRGGLRVYDEILRIRERIKARTGLHPDSVPMIRALREGVQRAE